MKTIFTLLLLGAFSFFAHAQDTAEPLPAMPAAPGTPPGEPATLIPEPPPLVPPASSTGETQALPAAQKAFQKSKTGIAAGDLDLHIRYRKAATQALQDPKLHEIKVVALAEKTEPAKRAGLEKYYAALYGRILKIDGSLKPEVEKRKSVTEGRLQQNKLRAAGADEEVNFQGE
jgi:hypothetical protein